MTIDDIKNQNPHQRETNQRGPGALLLQRAGLVWFLTAAFGQLAFIYFIVVYYGGRTLAGDFAGWNDKDIITGFVPGDRMGNVMFALHVLPAAAITFGGLIQLTPFVRTRWPALHRWNGRLFLFIAYGMACTGLLLTWGRGTYLSVISGVAISLDGVLILIFGAVAWRLAATGAIDAHRRWAMRTYMVVNGVWFFRVGIMAWLIVNQGPVGMTKALDGPADIAIAFGCYLIPLAVLELYFSAQQSRRAIFKVAVAVLVSAATLVTAIGNFGTIAMMWGPYLY